MYIRQYPGKIVLVYFEKLCIQNAFHFIQATSTTPVQTPLFDTMIFRPTQVCQYQFAQRKFANHFANYEPNLTSLPTMNYEPNLT